jgi:hypothetical protein
MSLTGEATSNSLMSTDQALCRGSTPGDQKMSHTAKIAIALFIVALVGIPSAASARGGLYPLTRCGPDLAYLCRIHGYFDAPPYRYSLAIYPGCIQTAPVETPNGIVRRRVVVCGAPDRPMVWGWW